MLTRTRWNLIVALEFGVALICGVIAQIPKMEAIGVAIAFGTLGCLSFYHWLRIRRAEQ